MIDSELERNYHTNTQPNPNHPEINAPTTETLRYESDWLLDSLEVTESRLTDKNFPSDSCPINSAKNSKCLSCETWEEWSLQSEHAMLQIEKKLIEKEHALQEKIKSLLKEIEKQNESFENRVHEYELNKVRDEKTIEHLNNKIAEIKNSNTTNISEVEFRSTPTKQGLKYKKENIGEGEISNNFSKEEGEETIKKEDQNFSQYEETKEKFYYAFNSEREGDIKKKLTYNVFSENLNSKADEKKLILFSETVIQNDDRDHEENISIEFPVSIESIKPLKAEVLKGDIFYEESQRKPSISTEQTLEKHLSFVEFSCANFSKKETKIGFEKTDELNLTLENDKKENFDEEIEENSLEEEQKERLDREKFEINDKKIETSLIKKQIKSESGKSDQRVVEKKSEEMQNSTENLRQIKHQNTRRTEENERNESENLCFKKGEIYQNESFSIVKDEKEKETLKIFEENKEREKKSQEMIENVNQKIHEIKKYSYLTKINTFKRELQPQKSTENFRYSQEVNSYSHSQIPFTAHSHSTSPLLHSLSSSDLKKIVEKSEERPAFKNEEKVRNVSYLGLSSENKEEYLGFYPNETKYLSSNKLKETNVQERIKENRFELQPFQETFQEIDKPFSNDYSYSNNVELVKRKLSDTIIEGKSLAVEKTEKEKDKSLEVLKYENRKTEELDYAKNPEHFKTKNNEYEDSTENYQKHKKMITFDEQKSKNYSDNKTRQFAQISEGNLNIKIGGTLNREKSSERYPEKIASSNRKPDDLMKTHVELISNEGEKSIKEEEISYAPSTYKTIKLNNNKVNVEKSRFHKTTTDCSFIHDMKSRDTHLSKVPNDDESGSLTSYQHCKNKEYGGNPEQPSECRTNKAQDNTEKLKLKFENENLRSYNRVLLEKLGNSRPRRY